MNLEISRKPSESLPVIKRHRRWESPKVSVIVPVYKVERYLTQCLCSIVNQTMEELEIIIVDEGDHDRCREIIDYFEARDPRIVAPHQKNGGYGASCNLGIRMARGEYLAIVESDDFIESTMYEEMYNCIKELDADILKTPYYDYFNDGRKCDCPHRKMMEESVPQLMCFSSKEYGQLLAIHPSLWSSLYRTSYIKQIKFPETKGGAYVDQPFRLDILINTDKIVWWNQPFYNYRVDSVGSSTDNYNLTAMLMRWREMHERCEREDYLKYYGPYLIIEEFRCARFWSWRRLATDEHYRMIAYNLSFSSEEMIEKSPVLDKYQKRELLELKKSSNHFRQRIKLQHIASRGRGAIRATLNVLSNPILLIWSFIGFFISLLIFKSAQLPVLFSCLDVVSIRDFFRILTLLFLIGISLCFLGKLLRRICLLFVRKGWDFGQ